MSITVSITDYDNNTSFEEKFNENDTLKQIKDKYLNSISKNEMQSKLYFFINDHIVTMDMEIGRFTSEYNRHSVYITAMFDYDNNFTNYNVFIWLSNEFIGQYYMFCPRSMKIKDIKKKYSEYLKKKNVAVEYTNIRFVSYGKIMDNDDLLEKYGPNSYYTVIRTYFHIK
jgi:hypothetical protein